jgi:anti-anti-sigma factor
MMMDYRHISVTAIDDVTVVRFKNLAKVVDFDESIREIDVELQGLLKESEPCSLVFDFENQEFMPSGFFDATLVRLQRMITQRNGTLRQCNLHPLVIQVFNINGLTDYFSLYNSLEDALTASRGQEPSDSDR